MGHALLCKYLQSLKLTGFMSALFNFYVDCKFPCRILVSTANKYELLLRARLSKIPILFSVPFNCTVGRRAEGAFHAVVYTFIPPTPCICSRFS